MSLQKHFASLDSDLDEPEEDLVASLLSAIGYSRSHLRLNPKDASKIDKYLQSEYNRLKK